MIRQGNIFAPGGSTSDDDLIEWIIREEGFNKVPEDIGDGKMTLGSGLTDPKWHALFKKRGNKWSNADNRRAVAEEVASRRRWAEKNIPNWGNLPDSTQKALISYKYNYDFNAKNSPKLFDALSRGDYREAARQIDATSKNPDFKNGLMKRRKREQAWFLSDFNLPSDAHTLDAEVPYTPMSMLPFSTAVNNPYILPEPEPMMVPREDEYVAVDYDAEQRVRENALRALENQRIVNAIQMMGDWGQKPAPKTEVFQPSSKYNFIVNRNADGGKLNQWDNLSLSEKAEMMKVAIKNGVTDLNEIKERYNEFAEGGHIYDGTTENSQQMRRKPMPPHPINRKTDSVAYDAYKEWETERQQRKQAMQEEREQYAQRKIEENDKQAQQLNHHKDIVMSALSNSADNYSTLGSGVREAAEKQRQDKLDEWQHTKNIMNGVATAGELVAAGYGITRGLTHLGRTLVQRATRSTGQAVSREAMQNLLRWNNRVSAVDKPQILMNTIGGAADIYQAATADNTFDAWENYLETGANAAGVVGGTNWFRNLPYLRTIGGNQIDAVLDGLGYGAAAWDVVKNLPPLSGALETARNNTIDKKALGGYLYAEGGPIHIKPENRGKFTALKERTGHSATWFKEHGTPAQRKMATFALNAKHWKHGLGGNLFDGLTQPTQFMEEDRFATTNLPEVTVTAPFISDSHRMRANLQENIARAAQKNRKDSYTLQENMNQTMDNVARNFGLNLFGLMGGSPIINAAWMTGSYVAPEVGEVIGGDTGRKIGEGVAMAAPFVPLGTKLVSEASKLPKYMRLNKTYGGVPHKQVKVNGVEQFKDGRPVYMDESFPKEHSKHTVWTSNDVDYAAKGTWSEEKNRSVFDVYTDPKELKILDTPTPAQGDMYYWQGLPFDLHDGKVILATDLRYNKGVAKTKEISLNNRGGNGRYDASDIGRYVHRKSEDPSLIFDWESVPGAVKTDKVVKHSVDNGYDAVRLHSIQDGPAEINGDYYYYPIDELILNEGAKKYILPHGVSKINLWNQLPAVTSSFEKVFYPFTLPSFIKNANNND